MSGGLLPLRGSGGQPPSEPLPPVGGPPLLLWAAWAGRDAPAQRLCSAGPAGGRKELSRALSVKLPDGVNSAAMDLAEFLVGQPPGAEKAVEAEPVATTGAGRQIAFPSPIPLRCEKCDGERQFIFKYGKSRTRRREVVYAAGARLGGQIVEEKLSEVWARNSREEAEITIADYRCRNCFEYSKQFAIVLWLEEDELRAFKIAEYPPFGERLPNELLRLLEKGSRGSKDLMIKGKSDLNAGRGIGAFAYYRRVVEDEKDALFDEAIRTARLRDDVTDDEVERLEAARDAFHFSESIKGLGEFFPAHLKVGGQNPLALLHDAMSKGLHAGTDEECLEAAGAVEQVLRMYVEGLADRRREAQDLREAVKLLRGDRTEGK